MALHTTQSAISCYENGTREPDMQMVKQLSDYFHCSVDYLLERASMKYIADEMAFENLSAVEAALVKEYRALPKNSQNKLIGYLTALKNTE